MRTLIVGCCALCFTVGLISVANSWQEENAAVGRSSNARVSTGVFSQDAAQSVGGYTVQGQYGVTTTSPAVVSSSGFYTAMDSEVAKAIKKLKDAETSSETAEAEKELRTALENDYDSRLAAYEESLDQLEAKLKEMRNQLNRRREAKDDMVSLRLQVLKAEADDLGWPSQMPATYDADGYSTPFNYAPSGIYGTRSSGSR